MSIAVAVIATSLAAASDAPLVGVEYFAGWWEPSPNKWSVGGEDWRAAYPDRVPLLGEYNTQETMDREIRAAADYGVDFFLMLWYYSPEGTEREPNARFLNRSVENFVASPESGRMRFMIEFVNHPPYEVASDADWQACIETWIPALRHPSYLKVDGRLVFKVHGGHHFLKQNAFDLERCGRQLNILRERVRDAGLGEMYIGCGVGSGEAIGPEHWAARLFDFTATYMDVPQREPKQEDYPYRDVLELAEKGRANHVHDAVPYMPYVPAGWNPRPWRDPRPAFSFPTREEWCAALESVEHDLGINNALGLPGCKAFTIYAWNEFGEGGIVAPTQGDQYMKLEEIRFVFGAAASK